MDCRFRLTAKFEIYGKTFDWQTSLNWTAQPGQIDRRITEWFQQCYEEAYAEYLEAEEQFQAERKAAAERESELAELARLRAKYPEGK